MIWKVDVTTVNIVNFWPSSVDTVVCVVVPEPTQDIVGAGVIVCTTVLISKTKKTDRHQLA